MDIAIILIFSKEYTHFEDVYFVNELKLTIGMITINIALHRNISLIFLRSFSQFYKQAVAILTKVSQNLCKYERKEQLNASLRNTTK